MDLELAPLNKKEKRIQALTTIDHITELHTIDESFPTHSAFYKKNKKNKNKNK